jgi:hypothetical protein
MEQKELSGFIARYISMWHEPNPELRNDLVHGLLTRDAENHMTKFAARGIDEILARVNRSYEEWVASKGYVFQPTGNTDSHYNLVKFFWQIASKDGGPVAAKELDIFVLAEDGRIQSLYQFGEATSS